MHPLTASLLALAVSVAACGPGTPAFKNTDLTGAEYGKALRLTDHSGNARTLDDFKGSRAAPSWSSSGSPSARTCARPRSPP